MKEDLKTSAAETVYGTSIRLLREFFINEEFSENLQIFFEQLRQHICKIRPTPSAHHSKPKVITFKDLYSCSYVFVRVDAVKKPLDCPYEGSYQIVERISDRVFKFSLKGEQVTVTTDRLKLDNRLKQYHKTQRQQHKSQGCLHRLKTPKRVTFAT